jgi:hypothetical protein
LNVDNDNNVSENADKSVDKDVIINADAVNNDYFSILLYKTQYKDLLKQVNSKIDINNLNNIKDELIKLESRIFELEKKNNKKSNLLIPKTDYMSWIKSLNITIDDIKESYIDLIGVIKNILIRNKFQLAGIFYKWNCGKKLKTVKILVSKKIIGKNGIILSYNWKYMLKNDIIDIIDYFWNIFKLDFIDWSNNINLNNEKNKNLYEKYYKNIMLISENLIIKEIKNFILKKI